MSALQERLRDRAHELGSLRPMAQERVRLVRGGGAGGTLLRYLNILIHVMKELTARICKESRRVPLVRGEGRDVSG